MTRSPIFRDHVIAWLESIIKSEYWGDTEVVEELDSSSYSRGRADSDIHPAALPGPRIAEMPSAEFVQEFRRYVNELAREVQLHIHTDTC